MSKELLQERSGIIQAGTKHLTETIEPAKAQPKLGDNIPLSQLEEEHIRLVLAATALLQEAADIFGVDQATLLRKRKTYGIWLS